MTSNCPGVNHEKAGKLDGCKDCPNANFCNSEKKEDPDIATIHKNLSKVKNIIAVMSGKGGVGKSTISKNLAETLANENKKTLLLDFDLAGPSIPRLTNTTETTVFESNNLIFPIQITKNFFCLSVGHFNNQKMAFNSSIKTNIIKKILIETVFDGFDFIVLDTPPGVSDEHLGIVNFMRIDHVILVSTPQNISLNDVKRQYDFCLKTKLNVYGIIENMKKFTCKCGHENFILNGNNIFNFCSLNNIKHLGCLDLLPEIARKSDSGESLNLDAIKNLAIELLLILNKKI
ncbi:hypothetical protein GVAV_002312 [Gurleya vavrai]